MDHKLHPDNAHRWESAERRQKLPPLETLRSLGLRKNDILADIGCGIGYFTLLAARLVGARGKVYALDTSLEMLEKLKSRLESSPAGNIQLLESRSYVFPLPREAVSFALIAHVLHEVEDPERLLRSAFDILTASGRIAVIEWRARKSGHGPPPAKRIPEARLKNLLETAGFEEPVSVPMADEFYALLARKPA